MFDKLEIDERVRMVSAYIVENRATIRKTAEQFKTSKSTVHKYLTQRLQCVDVELYNQVRELMDYNTSQRAIRGGEARRQKLKNKK